MQVNSPRKQQHLREQVLLLSRFRDLENRSPASLMPEEGEASKGSCF
jgi:hypothetical protein